MQYKVRAYYLLYLHYIAQLSGLRWIFELVGNSESYLNKPCDYNLLYARNKRIYPLFAVRGALPLRCASFELVGLVTHRAEAIGESLNFRAMNSPAI